MSIYDVDPDTGLYRAQPQLLPVTDEQVTAERERATRERYDRLDWKPVGRICPHSEGRWIRISRVSWEYVCETCLAGK